MFTRPPLQEINMKPHGNDATSSCAPVGGGPYKKFRAPPVDISFAFCKHYLHYALEHQRDYRFAVRTNNFITFHTLMAKTLTKQQWGITANKRHKVYTKQLKCHLRQPEAKARLGLGASLTIMLTSTKKTTNANHACMHNCQPGMARALLLQRLAFGFDAHKNKVANQIHLSPLVQNRTALTSLLAVQLL